MEVVEHDGGLSILIENNENDDVCEVRWEIMTRSRASQDHMFWLFKDTSI